MFRVSLNMEHGVKRAILAFEEGVVTCAKQIRLPGQDRGILSLFPGAKGALGRGQTDGVVIAGIVIG